MLNHKWGSLYVKLHGPLQESRITEQTSTFMVQNWETEYFWNQEGQEALYFQFQLNLKTLKFWPYVALRKKFECPVHRGHAT